MTRLWSSPVPAPDPSVAAWHRLGQDVDQRARDFDANRPDDDALDPLLGGQRGFRFSRGNFPKEREDESKSADRRHQCLANVDPGRDQVRDRRDVGPGVEKNHVSLLLFCSQARRTSKKSKPRVLTPLLDPAFDAIEQDLECGCRLSTRLDWNLGNERFDCFRFRVERHLDGAAADTQLVSVACAGCAFFAFPLRVGDGRLDRVVVELQLDGASADVGGRRHSTRPVQGQTNDTARNLDRDDTMRSWQEALHLGRTAVKLDSADVEASDLEHRVPGRALDLETPRVARVQLDLAVADAAQAPNHDSLALDYGRRGRGPVVGRSDQPLHVAARSYEHAP